MTLIDVPGHESVFPLQLAMRLLKLNREEMKERMEACRVTLKGVETEAQGFISYPDMLKMVAYAKEKTFYIRYSKNNLPVANPKMGLPSGILLFLDARTRDKYIWLWKTVTWGQKGRGEPLMGWKQFMSICLRRAFYHLNREAYNGATWWTATPREINVKKMPTSKGHARPLAPHKWPQPMSVPDWMLKKEFKPGGVTGARKRGRPKNNPFFPAGAGPAGDAGLDEEGLE